MADVDNPLLRWSEKALQARRAGRPLVALESTIITHGMPYPQNLQTAREVEGVVRAGGAEPATIAVMGGKISIGLEDADLVRLAEACDVAKLSRADLAHCLATGAVGSTTVAATMMAAELAGIEVFATGGIGGVHKGGEVSLDISADLTELAQTNVIVVCAGAKAILDIGRTLEVLETLGIPVIGYQTDELPAFWSRQSGFKAPLRADTPQDITKLWQTRQTLGQKGGLLVANPVSEEAEIGKATMDEVIAKAVKEAEANGITGKGVTPWLLSRIVELTEGRSLETNIALIKNNAALAAGVSVAAMPIIS